MRANSPEKWGGPTPSVLRQSWRVPFCTDLEGRQAHLRLRGVIQAEGAFPDFGRGLAFEAQWKTFAQRAGVAGKIRKAFQARLGPANQAEQAAASRTSSFHQLQGQPAHGVAGVDFHDRLEPAVALRGAIDESVDADRPGKAGALQFRFEQRKDVAIEALEAARNVRRFAEQRCYVRR